MPQHLPKKPTTTKFSDKRRPPLRIICVKSAHFNKIKSNLQFIMLIIGSDLFQPREACPLLNDKFNFMAILYDNRTEFILTKFAYLESGNRINQLFFIQTNKPSSIQKLLQLHLITIARVLLITISRVRNSKNKSRFSVKIIISSSNKNITTTNVQYHPPQYQKYYRFMISRSPHFIIAKLLTNYILFIINHDQRSNKSFCFLKYKVCKTEPKHKHLIQKININAIFLPKNLPKNQFEIVTLHGHISIQRNSPFSFPQTNYISMRPIQTQDRISIDDTSSFPQINAIPIYPIQIEDRISIDGSSSSHQINANSIHHIQKQDRNSIQSNAPFSFQVYLTIRKTFMDKKP